MRTTAVALILLSALILVAHENAGTSSATSGIIATWDVNGEIYRTHIENPDTIEQVYALQSGESTASIPVGRLRSGTEYNGGWSWHTDPQEIEMADFATEVCDGLPSYVEADQDYWINTVRYYCPWSAVLLNITSLDAVGGVTELTASTAGAGSAGRSIDAGGIALLAGGAALVAAVAGVWTARHRLRS